MKVLFYTIEKEESKEIIAAIREYCDAFGYEDVKIDIYAVKEPKIDLTFEKMMIDYVLIFTDEDIVFGKTRENVIFENIIKVEREEEEIHFLQFYDEDFAVFDKMINILENLNFKDRYNCRRVGEAIKTLKDFKDVL